MGILDNTQVTTLLGLGADAMDNMYDMTLIAPPGLATSIFESRNGSLPGGKTFNDAEFLKTITIRADGFNPPKFNVKTYAVGYKGIEIERPATKLEGKRSFDISFRLDANYQGYRFLSAWKSLISQASTGYITNALWGEGADDPSQEGVGEINKLLGSVSVRALSKPIYMKDDDPYRAQGVTYDKIEEDNDDTISWHFFKVWIKDLDEPSYKTEGGDAIKIKATFNFADFKDPIANIYVER
jgi:hypothetical protein